MELHEFLNQWLSRTAWTVTRLADEVGVSPSLVSKWLNRDPRRRVLPNRENMRTLARVLGVSKLELLRMAGYVDGADVMDPSGSLDPDLAAINAVWPRLDDGLKRAIRVLASAGASLTVLQLGPKAAAQFSGLG